MRVHQTDVIYIQTSRKFRGLFVFTRPNTRYFSTRLILENKDSYYIWEVKNKMDLSETGCKGAKQIHPSHDKDH